MAKKLIIACIWQDLFNQDLWVDSLVFSAIKEPSLNSPVVRSLYIFVTVSIKSMAMVCLGSLEARIPGKVAYLVSEGNPDIGVGNGISSEGLQEADLLWVAGAESLCRCWGPM